MSSSSSSSSYGIISNDGDLGTWSRPVAQDDYGPAILLYGDTVWYYSITVWYNSIILW